MYVSEEDRTIKRKVKDNYVNEEFQEALKCDPSLMIEEVQYIKKTGWIKKKKTVHTYYNVYHETPSFDGRPYQARYQSSGSGEKKVVIAYLHGIINGVNHNKK